jgi:hypothetical protein
VVIGLPIQNRALSDCNKKGDYCGQYYRTFEDDSASGDVTVALKVKQRSTTIQSIPPTLIGSLTGAPVSIYAIDCYCVNFKKTAAVVGPATIAVTTTVGSTTITGKATINLE